MYVMPYVLPSAVGYPYAAPPYNSRGLAPQGFLGGALGSMLGGAVGGLFGGSGSSIGSSVGGIAGALLPFAAGGGLAVAGAEVGSADPSASQKPVLLPQSFLDPEAVAQQHVMQASSKGLIDQLASFLKDNQQDARLSVLAPLFSRAVELYKANDFQRSAVQSYFAFHTIESVRVKHPDIPAVFT